MSKQLDNWYFELNTLLEDGTSLYNNGNYHGRYMEQQKKCRLSQLGNCLVANGRIHSLRSDGSETGKNAYGYTDNKGNFCRSVQSFRLWY
ncbi:carbohydrate porin [Escherichia coli]|uniref:carbohydrate porin n=1 Tax=Escherichia coli TaxID=562 RepID=UPI003EBC1895